MLGMTNPAEQITPTPELLRGRTLGTRNIPEMIYLRKGVISPITAEGMIVAPLLEAYLLAMCVKPIVGRPTQLFHTGEKVDLEIPPVREWSFLRDLLLKNMGWTVGDGVSINIWQDPWLCLNKQERPMGPPSGHSVDLCVADLLVDGGKHWDRQKLQLLLPAYEEKMLCIKPSLIGAQDKLIWLGRKGGEYSVKSGYYVAVEEEPDTRRNDAGFNWKRNVWALDCAPKVKLFAWKLLKGAIPVGERLLERHIEVDPRCKRCGNNESITHLLFQCQFAQKVWQLAPLLPGMDSSGMLDLMVV